MMKRDKITAAIAILLLGAMSSCSKEEKQAAAPKEAASKPGPSGVAAPVEGKGTVAGKVVFKGKHAPAKLSVGKDREVCGDAKQDPTLIVGTDGGVRNAVIQIAGLREGKTPAKEAELDQVKCEYEPHVLVVPAGATVKIKNSDGILHNVHTLSKDNAPFNRAQPKFIKELSETFATPEIIPVRCDVHGWMSGWIVVTDNVFFDVSKADGAFQFSEVPAGKHSIEVWHESLGKTSQEVEVKPGETVTVSFEFALKK